MRFGILNTTLILFICLNIQLSYSQDVTRVSEFKTSTFRGTECDDTEYRNSNGRPNWKNYGKWLSECDSLSTTYYDAEFAIKRKKKQEEERLAKEKELAMKARIFANNTFREARVIEFKDLKWDKYGGRILSNVYIDGYLYADMIINEQLARPYDGGKKEGWCE